MKKFAIALPTQRTEAILEGMTQAFDRHGRVVRRGNFLSTASMSKPEALDIRPRRFGCVPKEVWWDNPRTVADAVLKGRERKVNSRYAALASHFAFEPAEGGLHHTATYYQLSVELPYPHPQNDPAVRVLSSSEWQ